MAFDYMDYDRSGTLSVTELREQLGENMSEEAYKKLIKEYDTDRDGEISRSEFKSMMKKIIRKQIK